MSTATTLKPLTDAVRCTRIRDLEHHCRCWVNAYVQELEGRATAAHHGGHAEARARHWRTLCDLMFGILVQEGMVERIEEEIDEEPE